MIVDRAMYCDGQRVAAPESLAELSAACRNGDGLAWIGLYRPDAGEFAAVAAQFDLHALAVEDAVKAHQRPKLDRYGDMLFLVLRPARYVDATETVEFGEVHMFAGPHYVITVRHSEAPDLARVRHGLEARPDLLRRGPGAIVHAIIDRVVDDYAPVVAGLQEDIDEIENDVFDGTAHVSRRIYDLAREVIQFQRATKPLDPILKGLMDGAGVSEEETRYLRDVEDHAIHIEEQVSGFRELLQNIVNVNLTLETKALSEAANTTNVEVQKISAWAAIFFAPTLIGTIYGMNFKDMPELHWALGYPYALSLMVVLSVGLYILFRRRGWI
jgi:magnesium transporter